MLGLFISGQVNFSSFPTFPENNLFLYFIWIKKTVRNVTLPIANYMWCVYLSVKFHTKGFINYLQNLKVCQQTCKININFIIKLKNLFKFYFIFCFYFDILYLMYVSLRYPMFHKFMWKYFHINIEEYQNFSHIYSNREFALKAYSVLFIPRILNVECLGHPFSIPRFLCAYTTNVTCISQSLCYTLLYFHAPFNCQRSLFKSHNLEMEKCS